MIEDSSMIFQKYASMMTYEPIAPGSQFKYCKWEFGNEPYYCPEEVKENDDEDFEEEDEEKDEL